MSLIKRADLNKQVDAKSTSLDRFADLDTVRVLLERVTRAANDAMVTMSHYEADQLDREATSIAQTATLLASFARARMGQKGTDKLITRVRKALGFAVP